MQTEIWKNNILDVVRRISDKKYQEETWFGSTEAISSPEELYCELFDDYIYDDFLESSDVNLTKLQRQLGFQLREKLNAYLENIGDLSDPQKIFVDPEWNEIRAMAKKFLDSFFYKLSE